MGEYLIAAFIMFAAFLVKGIAGFGNSMILNPTLSIMKPAKLITATDVLVSIPINGYLTWKFKKGLDYRVVVPISLMLIIGSIPGMLFLKFANDSVIKILLGAVVIVIAADMYIRNHTIKKQGKPLNRSIMLILGLVAGVLSGMFGMAMLIVAYIGRNTKDTEAFKTNTCAVLLIDCLFRTITYSITGIINRGVLLYSLSLLPFALLGMVVGIKLDLKVPEALSNTIISVIIAISGVYLIVQNIIALIR